jgi:hypothetical protein
MPIFNLIVAAVVIFALGAWCGVSWALRELAGRPLERRQTEYRAFFGSSG